MEDFPLSNAPVPGVPGYDVGRCLGRGASAAVWLVTERASAREYALKCFSADDGPDGATGADAVRREIRVLSILDHEHLVRAYDVVQVSGGAGENLGLTMDYAAGGSLAQLIASRGTLGPGETVTVLIPIAQALAYLHGQGFTHGDVSPGNVLFTAEGKPLLADLGVARMVADARAVADAGTEGFSDPAPVDAVRAGLQPERDLYSLAAVGWYCLTGHPPEPGAERPPLPLLVPGVPPALAATLESALQEDRRLRPSAAELASAVQHSAPAAPVDLSVSVHPSVLPQLLTRRALPGTARERRIERLRALPGRLRGPRVAVPGPADVPYRRQSTAPAHGAAGSVRGQNDRSTGIRPAARHVAGGESGRQSGGESGRQSGGESGRQCGGESGRQAGSSPPGRPGSPVRLDAAHPQRTSGAFRAAAVAVAVAGILVAVWTSAGAGLIPGLPFTGAVPVHEARAEAPAGPDVLPPGPADAGLSAGVRAQLASQDPAEAVRGLAWIRSRAFSSGDFRLLEEVNVPGSAAAAADRRISAALKASGHVLAGFETVVTGVEAERVAAPEGGGPSRAVVAVTSRTPAYQERDSAGNVLAGSGPAPEQRLRLVLSSVEGRWRIQDILAAGTAEPGGQVPGG